MMAKDRDPEKAVGYDARQKYYTLIIDNLAATSELAANKNFWAWLNVLELSYSYACPWVGPNDCVEIEEYFDELYLLLDKYNKLNGKMDRLAAGTALNTGKELERGCMKMGRMIVRAAKHMMLPEKEWDDEPTLAIDE